MCLFSHTKWPVISFFQSVLTFWNIWISNHKTATLSPFTSLQYANYQQYNMQMSWHAMLGHGSKFIQSLSFKTLKAMFSSVIVCWGLNHQLLILPLPSTPSCPWIPHDQTISHHSTVVICHFLTNLYLAHFNLTEPTVSQIANYASDGAVSWILSCRSLYACLWHWLCKRERVVWFLCPLASTTTVNGHW